MSHFSESKHTVHNFKVLNFCKYFESMNKTLHVSLNKDNFDCIVTKLQSLQNGALGNFHNFEISMHFLNQRISFMAVSQNLNVFLN